MTYSAVITSPIGKLGIETEQNYLVAINFLESSAKLSHPENNYAELVIDQINHYFNHSEFKFNLSLYIEGTDFQKKVWQSLRKIPSGTTLTYGELAKKIASGPRAIGAACRTNRIPLVIPCHRIVAAKDLGGFSGAARGRQIEIKKWLLAHERKS
jgi:methylated-DNA-[protein]-cysteine S-methyltransferase